MKARTNRGDMAGYTGTKPKTAPQLKPKATAPSMLAPTGPNQAPFSPMQPQVGGVQMPPGAPSTMAPSRRVDHPPRVVEHHSVIRYPVCNVYPTHVRHVRHHVCEYYCQYPVSQSVQDRYHTVDHCRRSPQRF